MCFANRTLVAVAVVFFAISVAHTRSDIRTDDPSKDMSTPQPIVTTEVKDLVTVYNSTEYIEDPDGDGTVIPTTTDLTDPQLAPTRVKLKPTVTVTATRIGMTRYFTTDPSAAGQQPRSHISPTMIVDSVPYTREDPLLQNGINVTQDPLEEEDPFQPASTTTTTTTGSPVTSIITSVTTTPGEDLFREDDKAIEYGGNLNEPKVETEIPDGVLDDENDIPELLPKPVPLIQKEDRRDEQDELAEALNHHNNQRGKTQLRRRFPKKNRRRIRKMNTTISTTTSSHRLGIYEPHTERPNSFNQVSGSDYLKTSTPKPFIPRMRMTRRFRSTTTPTTVTSALPTAIPESEGGKTVRNENNNNVHDDPDMPLISELAITEIPAPRFSAKQKPILLKSPLISSFTTPGSDDYSVTAEPQLERTVPLPYTESAPPSQESPDAQALRATESPESAVDITTPHNNETGEWLTSDNSRHTDTAHQTTFYGLDRDNWEKNYMTLQQNSFYSPSEEQHDEEETPIITLEDVYGESNRSSDMEHLSPEPKLTVIEHHHLHPGPPGQSFGEEVMKEAQASELDDRTKITFSTGGDDRTKILYRTTAGHATTSAGYPPGPAYSQSRGRDEEEEENHVAFIVPVLDPENKEPQPEIQEHQSNGPYFNPYPTTTEFKWPQSLSPQGSHYDGSKKHIEYSHPTATVGLTSGFQDTEKPSHHQDKPLIVTEIETPSTNAILTEIEYYKDENNPPVHRPVLTRTTIPSTPPQPPTVPTQEYYSPKPGRYYNSAPSPYPGMYAVDVMTEPEMKEPVIKYKAEAEQGAFVKNILADHPNRFRSITPVFIPSVSPSIPPPKAHGPPDYHFLAGDSRNPPTPNGNKNAADSSVVEIHHHHFPDGTSYAVRQPAGAQNEPPYDSPAPLPHEQHKEDEETEVIMGTHWALDADGHFGPSSRTGLPQGLASRNPKQMLRPKPPPPPPPKTEGGFSPLKHIRFRDPFHASPSLTLPMPGLANIPTPPSEVQAMNEVRPNQHFPPHSHSMQSQSDYEPANPPLPTGHIFDHHFDQFVQNTGHFKDGHPNGPENHHEQQENQPPTIEIHLSTGDKPPEGYFRGNQQQEEQERKPPPQNEETYGLRNRRRKKNKPKKFPQPQNGPPPGPPPEYYQGNIEFHSDDFPGNNYEEFYPVPPVDHPNYSQQKNHQRPEQGSATNSQRPEQNFAANQQHSVPPPEINIHIGQSNPHDNDGNHGPPPVNSIVGGYNDDSALPPEQSSNNIQDLLRQLASSEGYRDNNIADAVSPYSDTPYILMFPPAVQPKPPPPPPPLVLPLVHGKDKIAAASTIGNFGPVANVGAGVTGEMMIGPGMKIVPIHPRQQLLKVLATKQYLKKMEALRERQNRPPAAIFTPYGVLVPMVASPDAMSHAGSSPPKLTTFLTAHARTPSQSGQKDGDEKGIVDEKSLLRALLSRSLADTPKRAKGNKPKALDTMLDSLAEKLVEKIGGSSGLLKGEVTQGEPTVAAPTVMTSSTSTYIMNDGSYSELKPIFAPVPANMTMSRMGGDGRRRNGTDEKHLFSSGAKFPSSYRKEQGKVLPTMPSEYFKSLLKERLKEMLEEKTQESSGGGMTAKGVSTLFSAGSHPFARRKKEKHHMEIDNKGKSSRHATGHLSASASHPIPSILTRGSGGQNHQQSTQKKQEQSQNHRPRFLPSGGGILNAIRRLFSFGRQEHGLLRKHSNATTLSRMKKRGDFPREKLMAAAASSTTTITTTASTMTVSTTTPTPTSYARATDYYHKKSTEDSRPLYAKYGFRSAEEFERTLKELVRAKKGAGTGGEGLRSGDKVRPYTFSREVYDSRAMTSEYMTAAASSPTDMTKLLPHHHTFTSTSSLSSPVSWVKSTPITVIPSPSLAVSPSFLPALGRSSTTGSSDNLLISSQQTQKSPKLLPVITKWKPIPETPLPSQYAAKDEGIVGTTEAAPLYAALYAAVASSPTAPSQGTTSGKVPANSPAEHLIRPRSV